GRESVDVLDDRVPDVPADEHASAPERQHAFDERRRRGLPLRAGDPDDRRGAEAEEEGHLREHRDLAVERAEDRRRARTDARDDEDEVRVGERDVVARWAEHERRGNVAEPLDALAELFARHAVGDRDLRAFRHQETSEAGCGPTFADSDDGHAANAELFGPDLWIEQHGHARRPMKPSCVPYRPSGPRPPYDHRSAPPLFVQMPATSMSRTPLAASCATFADQRSNTISPSRSWRCSLKRPRSFARASSIV